MSRLAHIQSATQQIAEAISSALDMDVTIVDENMIRIAGTGYHRDSVGQKISGNYIYQQVLEQAEEYIITDVAANSDCHTCANRASCRELGQLCCPIRLGKKTIGVIALIAFSPEQQTDLTQKGEQLLEFIRKMADLISAKSAEYETLHRLSFLKNQLETVLNFIAEGIIAIDSNAKIININFTAEKMLQVKADEVLGLPLNAVLPGTPITEVLRHKTGFIDREVSLWHNGRQQHYLINAKPLLVGRSIQGAVASLQTVRQEPPRRMDSGGESSFDDICCNSAAIKAVKAEALKAAQGMATVLLTGESGTGKEVFARAIHAASARSTGPFVVVNCAAIPENLLESELFGYDEGSFTGARKGGKPGKFELASRGTLFLDEIGDMPLLLQSKMLRVLQEKIIDRVGGVSSIKVDVRIIAATNQDLEGLVRDGKFRKDLFYRLSVFPIVLPALRDRKADITGLAESLLHKHALFYGKEIQAIAAESMDLLTAYNWPGNIRELENAMESAVLRMTGVVVEAEDLPAKIRAAGEADNVGASPEREELTQALQMFGTSVRGKKEAAASLGMGIATFYRKLKKYKLN
jgi:sigma-54 dependent transcriptional regulator, acetoin dehydrogenase operon transcriptional activator AcoR